MVNWPRNAKKSYGTKSYLPSSGEANEVLHHDFGENLFLEGVVLFQMERTAGEWHSKGVSYLFTVKRSKNL